MQRHISATNFRIVLQVDYLCKVKRLLAYIIAAVIATALGGCHRGAETRRALLRADSLIYPHPDSALALLRSLDMSRATEAQMARYALLVTKAEYKTGVIQPNDSLISIAVDFYAGRRDSLEMQSLFYKGHIRSWKKCDNEALILLAKAARIAVANHDYLFLGLIYRTQAEIYSGILARQPQLESALKAIDAFKKANAMHHAVWEHETAAQALIFIDPHKGLEHMDTVRRSPYFANDKSLQTWYYDDLVFLLQAAGDTQAAADSIALADSLGLVIAPKAITNLAAAYFNVGRHALARKTLERLGPNMNERAREYTRYFVESYLDEEDGDYKSALANMRLYDKYSSANKDSLLHRPYTLDLNRFIEAEAEAAEREAADFKVKSFLCIGILVLIILLIIARLVIVRKNYQLKTAEINLFLSRSEAMDSENMRLNAELAAMRDSVSVDSEMIDSLRRELNDNISRRIDIIDRICYLWMTSPDAKKSDSNIRQRIDKLIGDDLFASLENIIDRRHDGLTSRIKADKNLSLTDDQYSLLLMMLAGFSREGMMAILDKERNALTVAIHRLKKLITSRQENTAKEIVALLSM